MDKVRASIAVQSRLSDLQEEIGMTDGNGLDVEGICESIKFIKYLIIKTDNDLTKEINVSAMYDDYEEQYNS